MIRRENVSTIMAGEKQTPFEAAGLDRNWEGISARGLVRDSFVSAGAASRHERVPALEPQTDRRCCPKGWSIHTRV